MIFNLVSTSTLFKDFYVIVDGLDECQEKSNKEFILSMFDRLGKTNLHVLVTSRLENDIKEAFTRHPQMAMDEEAVKHDIKIHIDIRLEYDIKLKKIQPDTKKEIKEHLLEKSEGM